jgi:hypothetical protein
LDIALDLIPLGSTRRLPVPRGGIQEFISPGAGAEQLLRARPAMKSLVRSGDSR